MKEENCTSRTVSSETNRSPFIARIEYFQQGHLNISLLPMCIPTLPWNYKRRLPCYQLHKLVATLVALSAYGKMPVKVSSHQLG